MLNFQGHLVDPLVQYPVSCQHRILFFSSWLFRILYTKWLAFPYPFFYEDSWQSYFTYTGEMPQNTRKLNDMPNITKAVKMAKRNLNSRPQTVLLYLLSICYSEQAMFLFRIPWGHVSWDLLLARASNSQALHSNSLYFYVTDKYTRTAHSWEPWNQCSHSLGWGRGVIKWLKTGEGHGNPLQNSCLEDPHGQRSLAGFGIAKHRTSQNNWARTHA